jgi:Ca2+:H+ antiporter
MRNVAYGLTALLAIAGAAVELLGGPVLLVFTLTALALVGLAWVLGQATESVGHYAGPRIGGILNATFGNAAELIITIFALSAGLTTVVKASIIGSVIGNVLLVLGASILVGGLKNGIQSFSTTIAGANAAMLAIVVFGLALPTVFGMLDPGEGNPSLEYLSISVAVVLLVLYALYLLFYLSRQGEEQPPGTGEEEQPPFGKVASYVVLLGTTAAVAYVSEAFVGAIEPLVEEIGVSELFIGVIVVPIVGK